MEKRIGAFEARHQLGRVLQEVVEQGVTYIVERHGEPVAALVSIELYNQWKRRRTAFFDQMEEIATGANLSPEEAATLAQEAVQAVRTHPNIRESRHLHQQ